MKSDHLPGLFLQVKSYRTATLALVGQHHCAEMDSLRSKAMQKEYLLTHQTLDGRNPSAQL